jgi:hypothetical protein
VNCDEEQDNPQLESLIIEIENFFLNTRFGWQTGL